MFESIIDLVQIILRNGLFVVGQSLIIVFFFFVILGILFLIKGKGK